jgi:phytanoyl-CoA hydroxylase
LSGGNLQDWRLIDYSYRSQMFFNRSKFTAPMFATNLLQPTDLNGQPGSRDIAAEQQECFLSNGYVVIRNLIEPKVCQEILKEAEEMSCGARWHPDWNPAGMRSLQQLGNFSCVVNDVLMSNFVSRARSVAQQLLGQEVVLWGDQMIMKPPGCDVQIVWHQDAAYWCNWSDVPQLPEGRCLRDQDKAITCWLALDDVTQDMAPLCYLPGSHKQGIRHSQVSAATNHYNGTDPLYLDPEAVVPFLDRLVCCPLKAGDCTFHDGRTMHSSHSNTSARPRYGFAMHFWPLTGWDWEARAKERRQYFERDDTTSSARAGSQANDV